MKTTEEMIAVMQAYADGKETEWFNKMDKKWFTCVNPAWDWPNIDYRVKPEPPKKKLVPYESVEEFLEDQRKHGYSVRKKEDKNVYASFVDANMHLIVTDFDDYIKELSPDFFVREFVWLDSGTPCGKEVEV